MPSLPRRITRFCAIGLILALGAAAPLGAQPPPTRSVSVTLGTGLTPGPETGRVFVLVTDRLDVEPRLVTPFTGAYYFNDPRFDYAPFFGQDVNELRPGATILLSGQEMGFPFADFSKLPPGEYSVQAVLNRYEQVTPGARKAIWLPMNNWWPGAQFHGDADNFYSDVKRIKVEQGKPFKVSLTLTKKIPPVEQPEDTKFL